ncbi:dTDP-4-dehydrorhamnose 3,5-epimerase family protein [Amycolatopsis sp. NPDC051758]|uniref:dTDP-4-dehydrorhamnose 3,5-epimerase family protein n=1 Tax=Amycolatopsis sp. NPDC051758 TaxID=3363935 RepID=UPI00379CDC45
MEEGAGAAMTCGTRPARVVIRRYSGDRHRHAYPADDLASSGYQQVHPVCHASLGYDLAHPTDMIGPADYRDLGNLFDGCGSCRRWLHNTQHEVVIAEELAALLDARRYRTRAARNVTRFGAAAQPRRFADSRKEMRMQSQVEALPIAGAWKVTTTEFTDDRGSLHELFHSGQLGAATGVGWVVPQANCVTSHSGVLRGIRVSTAVGPAKYVTCLHGAVLDVVVDVRVGSPTYGHWHAEHLTADNRTALYLAPGLGHTYLALSEPATVLYLLSQLHREEHERSVHALDPDLAIAWPHEAAPLMSAKDAAAPTLSEAREQGLLPAYASCPPAAGRTSQAH